MLAVAVLGGLLLALGELLPTSSVSTVGDSCEVIYDNDPMMADLCSVSGLDRHRAAFGFLGLLALLLGWEAARGSRAASGGLIAIGAPVALWLLLVDLPEAREAGEIGRDFVPATAKPGVGLWLQLVGSLLLVAAGTVALRRPGRTSPK